MSKLLLVLCMVIAVLVVPAGAIDLLCPFGNDPQTLVPCCQISAESTFTGTTNGIAMMSQGSTSARSNNGSQIVASSFDYMGLPGLHDISTQSTTSNKQIGVTSYNVQSLKYAGMGATLKTKQYGFEAGTTSSANACSSCNLAYSGSDADITDGEYSAIQDTSILGHLSSQYAMTAFGNGKITTFSSSWSHSNQTIDNNQGSSIAGGHTQSFWSTMMGTFNTAYVYNYKAGI